MDTDELLAKLHATPVRDLARTAYMFTHQMHALGSGQAYDRLRSLRDMIDAEIARRCGE